MQQTMQLQFKQKQDKEPRSSNTNQQLCPCSKQSEHQTSPSVHVHCSINALSSQCYWVVWVRKIIYSQEDKGCGLETKIAVRQLLSCCYVFRGSMVLQSSTALPSLNGCSHPPTPKKQRWGGKHQNNCGTLPEDRIEITTWWSVNTKWNKG